VPIVSPQCRKMVSDQAVNCVAQFSWPASVWSLNYVNLPPPFSIFHTPANLVIVTRVY
jgi:hypothetical protein